MVLSKKTSSRAVGGLKKESIMITTHSKERLLNERETNIDLVGFSQKAALETHNNGKQILERSG